MPHRHLYVESNCQITLIEIWLSTLAITYLRKTAIWRNSPRAVANVTNRYLPCSVNPRSSSHHMNNRRAAQEEMDANEQVDAEPCITEQLLWLDALHMVAKSNKKNMQKHERWGSSMLAFFFQRRKKCYVPSLPRQIYIWSNVYQANYYIQTLHNTFTHNFQHMTLITPSTVPAACTVHRTYPVHETTAPSSQEYTKSGFGFLGFLKTGGPS